MEQIEVVLVGDDRLTGVLQKVLEQTEINQKAIEDYEDALRAMVRAGGDLSQLRAEFIKTQKDSEALKTAIINIKKEMAESSDFRFLGGGDKKIFALRKEIKALSQQVEIAKNKGEDFSKSQKRLIRVTGEYEVATRKYSKEGLAAAKATDDWNKNISQQIEKLKRTKAETNKAALSITEIVEKYHKLNEAEEAEIITLAKLRQEIIKLKAEREDSVLNSEELTNITEKITEKTEELNNALGKNQGARRFTKSQLTIKDAVKSTLR